MEGIFLQELEQYIHSNIQRSTEHPLRPVIVNEGSCFKVSKGVFQHSYSAESPKEFDAEIDLQQFRRDRKPSALPTRKLSERTIPSGQQEKDIEEYIRKTKVKETFSTKLLKYIDSTGLPDADIYKKAGIDRRHFSKIRCDRDYRPKKATVIALCLALELKLEQVEEVLGLAGYYLSRSDTTDLIVRFCIEKGKYDLSDVNEALVYFGMKAIGVSE